MTTATKTFLATEARSQGVFARIAAWLPDVELLPVLAVAVVQIACLSQLA